MARSRLLLAALLLAGAALLLAGTSAATRKSSPLYMHAPAGRLRVRMQPLCGPSPAGTMGLRAGLTIRETPRWAGRRGGPRV